MKTVHVTFSSFLTVSIQSGSMLNLTHGVWYFYSLRRLANVDEMFSVTSCVERRRCRCGFSSIEKSKKVTFNQEQRGRQ